MICEVVWKPGKRSLEAQHRVLVADNPARSAAIDSDLALCYPNDHRWDYVVVRQDGTGAAGNQRVETFERGCRDLARHIAAQHQANSDAEELDTQRRNSSVKRWTDKLTGMHNTLLSLDPVRDAELWTAVNAKLASLRQADGTNQTPWAQLQVDAFIATVATGDAVSRVPQVGG